MTTINFSVLSEEELETALHCLQAAVDGPFFPGGEFHTLFGLERKEVRSVINQWSNVDFGYETVMLTMNNSLNNLIGYPHGQDEVLERMVGASEAKLRQLLRKLKSSEATYS